MAVAFRDAWQLWFFAADLAFISNWRLQLKAFGLLGLVDNFFLHLSIFKADQFEVGRNALGLGISEVVVNLENSFVENGSVEGLNCCLGVFPALVTDISILILVLESNLQIEPGNGSEFLKHLLDHNLRG